MKDPESSESSVAKSGVQICLWRWRITQVRERLLWESQRIGSSLPLNTWQFYLAFYSSACERIFSFFLSKPAKQPRGEGLQRCRATARRAQEFYAPSLLNLLLFY